MQREAAAPGEAPASTDSLMAARGLLLQCALALMLIIITDVPALTCRCLFLEQQCQQQPILP